MTTDLPSHLLDLRRAILSMGTLVASRVDRVIGSLVGSDFTAASSVRHGDREVDVMEIDIEQHCIEVLALQQPVARDLRFILAILRINGELERIADLAKGIAKRVLHLESLGFLTLPPAVAEMGEAVRQLLSNALTALADDDSELARRVCRDDQRVDDLERTVMGWSQEELLRHPQATDAALDLIYIARGLERIGDMCTNIGEDVIFLVEGEVVRHTRM